MPNVDCCYLEVVIYSVLSSKHRQRSHEKTARHFEGHFVCQLFGVIPDYCYEFKQQNCLIMFIKMFDFLMILE